MPHRRALLALLDRYQPLDAADAAQAERIRDFVRREPTCFERACLEGHITGSAWLVDESGKRVLLTHHRKLGLWLQLGGHADGDSDVRAVALREAREESGFSDLAFVNDEMFDVDVHALPARAASAAGAEPAHLHFDVRFALKTRGRDFRVSPESHDLAWVDIERLGERTQEASMLRMAKKWLRRHVDS
jgi:8-oxo-dGTP pyrophosphatase MutT (NUDIX family)